MNGLLAIMTYAARAKLSDGYDMLTGRDGNSRSTLTNKQKKQRKKTNKRAKSSRKNNRKK